MTSTHELLIAAKNLISDPNHWTKNVGARNERGTHVLSSHPSAVCFCMLGALNAAAHRNRPQFDRMNLRDASVKLLQVIPDSPMISMFNDRPSTTHSDVMKVFDDAIAATAPRNADEYPFQAGDGVDSGSLGA